LNACAKETADSYLIFVPGRHLTLRRGATIDQGLGDLFVIRVAGKIVAFSQIGSVEFAAERFSTPPVMVLGLALRSCSYHVGGTHDAEGEAVAESSIDFAEVRVVFAHEDAGALCCFGQP
jgi:hypothetical protein